jgi:hypothetical protein
VKGNKNNLRPEIAWSQVVFIDTPVGMPNRHSRVRNLFGCDGMGVK